MTMSIPNRVLIAPSGFKENLDAREVAQAMARGVRRVVPGAVVDLVPMVDGGEGTAEALASITGGTLVPVPVTGPVGQPVDSHFARLGGAAAGTAVVAMAAAAGLRLVPRDLRDPTATTTRGVGELIKAALDDGARRIIMGCGDSGTSDGGAGLAQALGARILDRDGHEIGSGGAELARAETLDLTGLDPRLADCEMVAACNIHNVLTGPKGVARVFGPQKGATPDQVEVLAAALEKWAGLLTDAGLAPDGADLFTGPGTGASGGMGVALTAVCGARLAQRFEVLLDPTLSGIDFDRRIAEADLVFTAEGAVDYQTPRGKVPAEVALRAKRHDKPVVALAGSIGRGATDVYEIGIDAVIGIIPVPMDLTEAMRDAAELVANATERAMRLVLVGAGFHRAA